MSYLPGRLLPPYLFRSHVEIAFLPSIFIQLQLYSIRDGRVR